MILIKVVGEGIIMNKINLKRVQNILNLNDKVFDEKIIDWAKEFGFRIDGEYLITSADSVEGFINALEKQFQEWEKMEKDKSSKI